MNHLRYKDFAAIPYYMFKELTEKNRQELKKILVRFQIAKLESRSMREHANIELAIKVIKLILQ
jgi:hypothetical protein